MLNENAVKELIRQQLREEMNLSTGSLVVSAISSEMDRRSYGLQFFGKVNIVITLVLIFLWALLFTGLGESLGFQAGWITGRGEDDTLDLDANAQQVLAATRNLITVVSPIFIGLVIWMVTVVAERRLKAYDDTVDRLRKEVDSRLEKFHDRQSGEFQRFEVRVEKDLKELVRQSVEDFERVQIEKIQGLQERLQSDFRSFSAQQDEREESRTQRVRAVVSAGIKDLVAQAVDDEKEEFEKKVEEDRHALRQRIAKVKEINDRLEDRFGRIADYTEYADKDSGFGPITSVGAVHDRVTELFHAKKRSEAIMLTQELLETVRRARADTTGTRYPPAGSLKGDWFNLSAQLGRSDEEALALEVCLSGLEQQNDAPVFDAAGNINWQDNTLFPDDDLVAHAIQYAQTVSDPRLAKLIELSGYDPVENWGRPGWGWRSYSFVMSALASLGRHNEALALGHKLLERRAQDKDSHKVIQQLATTMADIGQRDEAINLLRRWLDENPTAPSGQIVTTLLNWREGIGTPEEIFALATRGIRDLAEEQPSANLGNLFYRRALAYDRLSSDDGNGTDATRLCSHVTKALADYATAKDTGLSPGLFRQVEMRRIVLERLAKKLGCDIDPDDTDDADHDDVRGEIAAVAKRVSDILQQSDLDDDTAVQKALDAVQDVQPAVRVLLRHMLRSATQNKDFPDWLRNRNSLFVERLG